MTASIADEGRLRMKLRESETYAAPREVLVKRRTLRAESHWMTGFRAKPKLYLVLHLADDRIFAHKLSSLYHKQRNFAEIF